MGFIIQKGIRIFSLYFLQLINGSNEIILIRDQGAELKSQLLHLVKQSFKSWNNPAVRIWSVWSSVHANQLSVSYDINMINMWLSKN